MLGFFLCKMNRDTAAIRGAGVSGELGGLSPLSASAAAAAALKDGGCHMCSSALCTNPCGSNVHFKGERENRLWRTLKYSSERLLQP